MESEQNAVERAVEKEREYIKPWGKLVIGK